MKSKKIEDMTSNHPNTILKDSCVKIQPNLSRKLLTNISLSDECKSIIYGTLLGDGSLQKTQGALANARLSIRHSEVQSEYFHWKCKALAQIRCAPKSIELQQPNGSSKRRKLLFQSASLESLTQIMSITHRDGKLCIQRRWLNHITPLSLAIWWCDAGSIIGNGRKGVLCTDGFDEASVRLLADYLNTVWNVYGHVGTIKRNRKYGNYSKTHYYRIWFGTEELKKLFRILLPSIPVASMLRKVIFIYKHDEFQQRWISEVKSALPHFALQIDEFVLLLRCKTDKTNGY
jgi:hypothetical protein